jgi:hypothetical protein
MDDDTAALSTARQTIRDEQRCEFWPNDGRCCYAPAAFTIATAWDAALRHACEAHREALDREVRVPHKVMPVSEWRASSRGYRPGLAGS